MIPGMTLPEIYSPDQLQRLRRELASEVARRKRQKEAIVQKTAQKYQHEDRAREDSYGGRSESTNKDRKRNLALDKKRYSRQIYALGTVCVIIDSLPEHGDKFVHRTCVIDRVIRLSSKFDPNRTLYRVIVLAYPPYFVDCVAIEALDCQMVSIAEIQKYGGVYEVPFPKREFKPRTSYDSERPREWKFPTAF